MKKILFGVFCIADGVISLALRTADSFIPDDEPYEHGYEDYELDDGYYDQDDIFDV